jgi:hypothetical protein
MDSFDPLHTLDFPLDAPPIEDVEPELSSRIPLDEDSQYWRPGTFCTIS